MIEIVNTTKYKINRQKIITLSESFLQKFKLYDKLNLVNVKIISKFNF